MIKEATFKPMSAYAMLLVCLGLLILAILFPTQNLLGVKAASVIGGIVTGIVFVFFCAGFFINNPNESKVLILFGTYKGTVKDFGFF